MSNATEALPVLAALRALTATIPDAALRKRIEAALDGKAAAEPEIQRKVIDGNEAAKILGCRRRTIQKLAAEGRIAVVRLPGRQLACGYLRESVEALAAGEVRTAAG